MIRVYPLACALFLFLAAELCADTTIVDIPLNYSVFLPDNWVRVVKSDSEQFFEDSTYIYPALLSLRRYAIDTTLYASADQWVSSHFIAYKLAVQYSVDPIGVVLYSNSDSTVMQGDLHAAEAYSEFFSYDTSVGSWSEYIRFTACGFGYELYAIGDTGDMASNIGYYAAILQGIRFLSTDHIARPYSIRAAADQTQRAPTKYCYDPLGRQMAATSISRYLSPGIYLRKNGPRTLYIR